MARKVFGGTKGEKLRQMMSEKKTFVPGEGVDMQEPVTRTNEEIQVWVSSFPYHLSHRNVVLVA